mmetsp:Transcript_40340/g.99037  ORF Transcript_40340/g.99037 Transcript_40340/m.99037 type:complete len:202 (+) Transcript_40340:35-640(+)
MSERPLPKHPQSPVSPLLSWRQGTILSGNLKLNCGSRDSEDVDEAETRKRELLDICKAKGVPNLHEIYRSAQVAALLRVYTPQKLYGYMSRGEEEWAKFFPRPEFMRAEVKRLVQSGAAFVRGSDKEGRPIMWVRESLFPNLHRLNSSAHCAYMFWIALNAIVQRPMDVPFIVMVSDEVDRKPLNYNLGAMRQFIELFRKL